MGTKIGITGANGFIGWHLQCYLKSLENIDEIKTAGREIFVSQDCVNEFVNDLDVVVHLAGVNRSDEKDLYLGNVKPAQQLVDALVAKNVKPSIIYASTTYASTEDTTYGKGKAEAGKILKNWGRQTGGKVVNLIIPHVYGEYGRPFYNSAVATFCHQIARDEELTVNSSGQLELVHVQQLAEEMVDAYFRGDDGDKRINGHNISVGEVVEIIQGMHDTYVQRQKIPDIAAQFSRNLFNSLRAAIPEQQRLVATIKREDDRGWLSEAVKVGSGGQCFVSTTKPGITRGNHYHRFKVERFFVLKGTGSVQIRRLLTDEIQTYVLSGDTPSYIDMPTLCTHKITNIGDDDLITIFWADEVFDPENPDTYFEEV